MKLFRKEMEIVARSGSRPLASARIAKSRSGTVLLQDGYIGRTIMIRCLVKRRYKYYKYIYVKSYQGAIMQAMLEWEGLSLVVHRRGTIIRPTTAPGRNRPKLQ